MKPTSSTPVHRVVVTVTIVVLLTGRRSTIRAVARLQIHLTVWNDRRHRRVNAMTGDSAWRCVSIRSDTFDDRRRRT